MNSWRQAVGAASARRGGWQPTPVHESQAVANAALKPVRPPEHSDAQGTPQIPGGRALEARDRAYFEHRLGADFSNVRIHADSQAAETADSLGARAMAVGSDIAFGPGEYNPRSASGRGLLAHELTHTVQQAQAREPAVQMQPKKQAAGLGSRPPKDDFTATNKTVEGDDFVLFDLDQATLSTADQKKLQTAAAAHKGAVTLTVHGYASEEGDADYNVNLAAWRAAAVKQFLSTRLAPGSKIILYSNGKTTDFGAVEQNRRAGFSLSDGAPDAKAVEAKEAAQKDVAGKKPGEPWTFDITGGKARKPSLLHLDDNLLTPGLTPGLGPGILPPASLPPLSGIPALQPKGGIDWSAIRPKFSIHGVTPDDRDLDAIEQHWNYSYNLLFGVLGDAKLAEKGANIFVPFAVNKWLTLEHPNAMDSAQQQFEQNYGGITTINIPLSDILDAALQKALHKDKPLFTF